MHDWRVTARLDKGAYKQPEPRAELKWVYIDLDATLAEGIWTPDNPTSDIGTPIWENVRKAERVAEAGFKIVIHTSRAWTDVEAIRYWLDYWDIPWNDVQCGKPLGVLYVDDRGRHSEATSWLPEDIDDELQDVRDELAIRKATMEHVDKEREQLYQLISVMEINSHNDLTGHEDRDAVMNERFLRKELGL